MTTKNEPLHSIQARMEELQNTITEKEKEIKERARNLKSELKEEFDAQFSPLELIRKHPFEAVSVLFVTGLVIAKSIGAPRCPSAQSEQASSPAPQQRSSPGNSVLTTIGLEALRSAKDIGFTYLQRYIDKKLK